jgi:hypothetical protein
MRAGGADGDWDEWMQTSGTAVGWAKGERMLAGGYAVNRLRGEQMLACGADADWM